MLTPTRAVRARDTRKNTTKRGALSLRCSTCAAASRDAAGGLQARPFQLCCCCCCETQTRTLSGPPKHGVLYRNGRRCDCARRLHSHTFNYGERNVSRRFHRSRGGTAWRALLGNRKPGSQPFHTELRGFRERQPGVSFTGGRRDNMRQTYTVHSQCLLLRDSHLTNMLTNLKEPNRLSPCMHVCELHAW